MHEILITEFEKELRNGSGEELRENGYNVSVAADGGEAFKKAGQTRFEMAFVDLVMPGKLTGFDIISGLRALSKKMIIIAFSESNNNALAEKAKKAGANEFIGKAELRDRMLETVDRYFNKTRKPAPSQSESPADKRTALDSESEQKGFTAPPPVLEERGDESETKKPLFIPDIFNGIRPEDLREIYRMSVDKKIASGAGFAIDVSRQLVIIRKGSARAWYRNCLIGSFSTGHCIGEASLFETNQKAFTIFLESDSELELFIFSKKELRRFFFQHKGFVMRYTANALQSLSRQLKANYEKMQEMTERIRSSRTGEHEHIEHKNSVETN